MKITPTKIHSMENNNLYTADELEFFKCVENQVFKPMGKKELKEQQRYWQIVAKNTLKRITKKP